ncbi:MAG TPA: AAA family ATPase, partial [Acidimicrobiales bacterium]|nr:AAA family ATPase [Acidimicrobiales bacterium]
MLVELAVSNLGVITDLRLVFSDAMTVVTGETGAGKTLIIDAIDLLAGGRADPAAVREGADEAVIEGRFVTGSDEVVVRRVVPARGRSRAYVDGEMATARTLSDVVA